jgi:hypothetical protein
VKRVEWIRAKESQKRLNAKACHNSFSVFCKAVFDQTKSNMRKWFFAIDKMVEDKIDISALQLSRQIEGFYQTSWKMSKLIRQATGNEGERVHHL